MEKRALLYSWGALGEKDLLWGMKTIGIQTIVLAQPIQDYHADANFAEKMINELHKEKFDFVFSYDYFPIISMICEINHIPYLSWIYDSPLHTLSSMTVQNDCNYIFCFDKIYAEKIRTFGAKNVCHQPLACNEYQIEKILSQEEKNADIKKKYQCEISFVGNFYNDQKNRIRQKEFSEYTKGYLEAVIEAQRLIYGYNFIGESIKREILDEIVENCDLTIGEKYIDDCDQMAIDMIGIEVTAREREKIVQELSSSYSFCLYSGKSVSPRIKGKYLIEKGYADYETEMPYVFHNSKINLNITSRTIQSGIPKRVLDILSCGGFCITNYQQEIAEYFVDGEELVMYSSLEDLRNKVEYYLNHEEERKIIAQNGNKKVIQYFGMQKALMEMLCNIYE